MAAEGTLLADRFLLGERIGEGSLSVVHAGVDRLTGQAVAIKLARTAVDDLAAARRRFEREAAALAVIGGPHVVELIAAGAAADGRPFLALERLVGRTLEAALAESGPLAASAVARCIGEAAAALELAHGVGTIHRDLKPANLFLHRADDGRALVKVLDFGMMVDTAGPTDRLRDGFGGTPFFMAPEQVRGQLSRIGPATDVWALAMVTLTLLTGELYWTATGAAEVMREIEASAIEPPSRRWPWLPAPFDDWFVRATRRVPERRFRSVAAQASELATALRGLRADAPGAARGARATHDRLARRGALGSPLSDPDLRADVADLTGDGRGATSPLAAASTLVAARTPTPSVIRIGARRAPTIGRELDQHAIEQRLAPGAIVTVTGTAGVGKTRLAQAVCEAASDRFVDGAWFVALPAGDGDGPVLAAIAAALGLAPDPTRPAVAHVTGALAPRRLLLALDGAERAPGCARVIDELRRACPAVTWLVTSRLPLGLADEHGHPLEPLEVPPTSAMSADEAETFSAVALFVRCAREAHGDFRLDDHGVADVIAICRAVDGFPLGLELAAARIRTSSPAQIRAELAGPQPAATSSARHAVAWSYGLLDADQQRLLRHLAILPAGLTFEQVRARLGHLGGDPRHAALRLVETHLVSWTSDPPRRLIMLDTVRELCRERSRAAGEDAALWRLAHDHAIAVATNDGPDAPSSDAWLTLVDAEHDNLRIVLDHLLDHAPADAMALAGRLAYYWYLRGDYVDGARWLEASIARSGAADGAALGRALLGAGRFALLTCRYAAADAWLTRARAIARDRNDERGQADAAQLLGSLARERGDYAAATRFHQRSLGLWQHLGDVREAARARNYLVFAAWLGDAAGDPHQVERDWWRRTSEAEVERTGDPEATVWFHLNRGAILHHAGDHLAARAILGRAFAEAVAGRFHEGVAWALDLLGKTSLARAEHLQARAQLAASLRVHRRLGDRWRCASVLEALAAVAVASDRGERAAVYLGAADGLRQQIGAPVPACERVLLGATAARAQAMLGDELAAGRARGRAMTLDQLVELARDVA